MFWTKMRKKIFVLAAAAFLAAGMENFDRLRRLHQLKKRRKFHSFGQRVDDGGFFLGGNLNEAKQRKICLFADKFQVYGNERVFCQPLA